MRTLIAVALLCASFAARADIYNVAAVMPCTTGATQAKLYVNGAAQALKPCGTTAQTYAGIIPTEGSYTFAYAGVSAAGTEGDKSPTTTAVIDKKPGTPANPPTVTITCPGGVPCPTGQYTITVTVP